MTHVEDSNNLRTTNQFVTQFHCLTYGINQKYTIVLLDITGHLLMKDEKYLKITVIGQVSSYITLRVNGTVIRGEARLVITSGFVIRRQPMLTSMLAATMSINLSTAVVPPTLRALSALKTDLPNLSLTVTSLAVSIAWRALLLFAI